MKEDYFHDYTVLILIKAKIIDLTQIDVMLNNAILIPGVVSIVCPLTWVKLVNWLVCWLY